MPAKNAKQYRLMAMIAHGGKPTTGVGPSKEVAEKFVRETPKEKRRLFSKRKKQMPRLDDDTKRLLKAVIDHFDNEDRIVREFQLRKARRLKLYWNNFSQIYWSESARDYRVYGADDFTGDGSDQEYYDRPVNILRAFLETVIAALSINIPSAICVPDDADNPADLATAKAGDKIAELLYKHNDIIFHWLHALYVYYTEGLVACYSYAKEDKAYGTYQERQYEDEEVEAYVCPHCGERLADDVFQRQLPFEQVQPPAPPDYALSDELENQFAPDDSDAELDLVLDEDGPVCDACLEALDPELKKTKLVIPRFVGMNTKPKSRVCFKVKGTLYVKIANYAKEPCDTPYLIDSYETHYANALHMYPELRDKLPKSSWANAGINDPYEQYARINPQYRNAFPEEQVTIKNAWLRPAAFEILPEEECKKLKRKFPDGAKATMVQDCVAEAENESLDDCWTIAKDPMHDYLNHDADGELLTNIQDITNDLISLTLQTIEHGIEQTWADPAVVNFDGQEQIEATPGYITAAKLQGGAKNISDAFFSTKSASLSPEVFQFYQIINQLGQFVSAAMPSIFGGSQEAGSSRTASEYAMSRTASLQRLQTKWRMYTIFWKTVFGKAIPQYIKLIKTDEKFVYKNDSGNYVNVVIRKAELSGKIGSVELEASENIPVSDEQKADIVMKLMELNNMEIMAALTSPENLPFIRKIVRMPEFRLPGEDDRTKQYEEIQMLTAPGVEPVIIPPDPIQQVLAARAGQQAPPTELPSIEVDPEVDNHTIEAEICRGWLVSEAGRLCKIENPPGYKNVLLHMRQHKQIEMQQMMQQQMAMAAQNPQTPANGKGQKQNTPAKPKQDSTVSEGDDVRTPVQQCRWWNW